MKKFLLLFFLIFSPMLFAQTSTEAFETESAGSTSFTDNGVTFNIISHTSTFNIVNYPATGWSGTVNDNKRIDKPISHVSNYDNPLEYHSIWTQEKYKDINLKDYYIGIKLRYSFSL
ncbi:hypothetical protein [Myroides odoratimimus]|nr:hypothetical protein [Myroides odoratimimus]MCS7473485.1 hypothetical protein [Myroides odoratimimus]MEC4028856.1 hypothetical protein [Myroides odoratimimus]MEC4035936.1 hypothetical protein [Myroides odoratimimus]MEC4043835.1 hypothetical protein [Myroides odoratimimus]MEC4093959.1 hypothetical protein [Myroides odoratimimus]